MDLLIPHRRDDYLKGIELHYAIKAARKYLPVDRILTIGAESKHCEHIPFKDKSTFKNVNIITKIRHACTLDISGPFICMSDDVFMLQPVPLNYWHCGPLRKIPGPYGRMALEAMAIGCVNNFDIHAPIVYHKELFLQRVPVANTLIQSLYCKDEPGEYMADIKFNRATKYETLKAAITNAIRFSTGPSGVNSDMRKLWEELYD